MLHRGAGNEYFVPLRQCNDRFHRAGHERYVAKESGVAEMFVNS